MSTPRNILDNYQSYTYYHILVACDSVETGEALAEEGELTKFDSGRMPDERLQPQFVSDEQGRSGNYIILMNGSRDADFFISTINWSATMMPTGNESDGDSPNPRSQVTVGEMTVEEPQGARFLNMVATSADRLGVDGNSMIFLLKTVFTGHRSDGGGELIPTVEPLMLTFYDISAQFSYTGSTYAISFSAVYNGAEHKSEVSAVVEGFTFELPSSDQDGNGPTIGKALESLQEKINDRYDKFKKKLKEELECAGVDIDLDSEFVDVKYRILVDDFYKDIGDVGSNELFLKKNFGTSDAITVEDDESISVKKLISTVLKSSQELLIRDNPTPDNIEQVVDPEAQGELAADQEFDQRAAAGRSTFVEAQALQNQEQLKEKFADAGSIKHTFKIHTTINSTPSEYVVTYHVKRHVLPFNKRGSSGDVELFRPPEGTGIEFDYIFTGQNVDIIDFDLGMNLGQAFYQTLLTSDTIPSAKQFVQYDKPQTISSGTGETNSTQPGRSVTRGDGSVVNAVDDPNEQVFGGVSKKPLFLGMNIRDIQRNNKQKTGRVSSYDAILQRFAMYESASAEMKIRGNLQLLAESTPLPSRIEVDEKSPVVTQDSGEGDFRNIMPKQWEQFGYAKVNVHMPTNSTRSSTSVDSSVDILSDELFEQDFAQNFWYPGWYFIRQIDNEFTEGGTFEQTLHMHAIPTDDSNQSSLGTKSCDEETPIDENPAGDEEPSEIGDTREQSGQATATPGQTGGNNREEKPVGAITREVKNNGAGGIRQEPSDTPAGNL